MRLVKFFLIAMLGQSALARVYPPVQIQTVPYDFEKAHAAAKGGYWYGVYSSHFFFKKRHCVQSLYYPNEPVPAERMHFFKRTKHNPDSLKWKYITNHFRPDPFDVGLSHWTFRVGSSEMLGTKSYFFMVDPDYRWSAVYYYGPNRKAGFITDGFDIRSTYLPLEPEIVDSILKRAEALGVPQGMINEVRHSPFDGCEVVNKDGEKYIYNRADAWVKHYSKGLASEPAEVCSAKDKKLCRKISADRNQLYQLEMSRWVEADVSKVYKYISDKERLAGLLSPKAGVLAAKAEQVVTQRIDPYYIHYREVRSEILSNFDGEIVLIRDAHNKKGTKKGTLITWKVRFDTNFEDGKAVRRTMKSAIKAKLRQIDMALR